MTCTDFKNEVLNLFEKDFYIGKTPDYYNSALKISNSLNSLIRRSPRRLTISKSISIDINNRICECIGLYYQGDFVNSYKVFENFLTLRFRRLNLFEIKPISMRDSFFRIRKGSNFKKRSDIFHVPLTFRTKIKGQRFSINGVPSLYLSNSIYTTWEEFNRPNLDDISFSRFQVSRPMDLLNLSISKLKDNFLAISNIDEAIQNVSYLLFVYLCSIKVKNPEDSFRPEYILPQYVLRWARSNNYDGVFYDSTKVHSESKGKFYNLVIPVRKWNKDDKYCQELRKLFELTSPSQLNNRILAVSSSGTSSSISKIYSQELKLPFPFIDSIFDKIENYLYSEPASFLV